MEEVETDNLIALEKYSQPAIMVIEQPSARQQQTTVIDVYGKEIEPICNYHTCNHRFSTHGHFHKCKCRHPINHAAGVSLWMNK